MEPPQKIAESPSPAAPSYHRLDIRYNKNISDVNKISNVERHKKAVLKLSTDNPSLFENLDITVPASLQTDPKEYRWPKIKRTSLSQANTHTPKKNLVCCFYVTNEQHVAVEKCLKCREDDRCRGICQNPLVEKGFILARTDRVIYNSTKKKCKLPVVFLCRPSDQNRSQELFVDIFFLRQEDNGIEFYGRAQLNFRKGASKTYLRSSAPTYTRNPSRQSHQFHQFQDSSYTHYFGNMGQSYPCAPYGNGMFMHQFQYQQPLQHPQSHQESYYGQQSAANAQRSFVNYCQEFIQDPNYRMSHTPTAEQELSPLIIPGSACYNDNQQYVYHYSHMPERLTSRRLSFTPYSQPENSQITSPRNQSFHFSGFNTTPHQYEVSSASHSGREPPFTIKQVSENMFEGIHQKVLGENPVKSQESPQAQESESVWANTGSHAPSQVIQHPTPPTQAFQNRERAQTLPDIRESNENVGNLIHLNMSLDSMSVEPDVISLHFDWEKIIDHQKARERFSPLNYILGGSSLTSSLVRDSKSIDISTKEEQELVNWADKTQEYESQGYESQDSLTDLDSRPGTNVHRDSDSPINQSEALLLLEENQSPHRAFEFQHPSMSGMRSTKPREGSPATALRHSIDHRKRDDDTKAGLANVMGGSSSMPDIPSITAKKGEN